MGSIGIKSIEIGYLCIETSIPPTPVGINVESSRSTLLSPHRCGIVDVATRRATSEPNGSSLPDASLLLHTSHPRRRLPAPTTRSASVDVVSRSAVLKYLAIEVIPQCLFLSSVLEFL
jgi:hypothetical protein